MGRCFDRENPWVRMLARRGWRDILGLLALGLLLGSGFALGRHLRGAIPTANLRHLCFQLCLIFHLSAPAIAWMSWRRISHSPLADDLQTSLLGVRHQVDALHGHVLRATWVVALLTLGAAALVTSTFDAELRIAVGLMTLFQGLSLMAGFYLAATLIATTPLSRTRWGWGLWAILAGMIALLLWRYHLARHLQGNAGFRGIDIWHTVFGFRGFRGTGRLLRDSLPLQVVFTEIPLALGQGVIAHFLWRSAWWTAAEEVYPPRGRGRGGDWHPEDHAPPVTRKR